MENNTQLYLDRTEQQKTFIMKVYNWMSLALIITGVSAFATAQSNFMLNLLFGNSFTILVLFLVELAVVWKLTAGIEKMSPGMATFGFLGYSALNGVLLSGVFILYTQNTITSAFLITAAIFGIMSVIGYFTKKDLTSIGQLCFMLLIGVIVASVINVFFHSTFTAAVVSYVAVFVFTGLIAYDTQKIKALCPITSSEDENSTLAHNYSIYGALSLYLDFINLFLQILRLIRD